MDVAQLITFAKESQASLKWDVASLIHIGGLLAVKVNGIQNLTGQEKGKLVCQVLKTVLEDFEKKEKSEAGKSEEEKVGIGEQFASLRKAVDDVVPASLELALAAARGKLDLKKVKMSVWVRYFSCCARSVVTALVSNNVISQDQAKQATGVLAAVEKKAVAVAEEKDKSRFEQENPMNTQTQEDAKTESKDEESQKPVESKQDTTQ
jgi:hypothetical protein